MKKGFCVFSLLILLFTPFSISADEYAIMPLWFEEDVNLLNATQQNYVCDNWEFVNSFDTIWYFTDTSILVFGNYISTDVEGYVSFSNSYILDSNGIATKQDEPRKWRDRNNVGAVYKSSGAFDMNVNNMNVINNCAVVVPPDLTLPTPNSPNITVDTEQSTYINTISSPASLGAVINYFRYDFFNIYAVHSSSLDFSILDEQDLLIKYQIDSSGRYLIPVYDHSEVVIYGPNLTISTSGLQITPSLYSGVSYSFPNSNGIIQRDINRFDYTYVDLEMLNMYPYEDLPFSNSSSNTGKVDYLGQQLSVRSGGTGSRSIMLEFNGRNYSTTFYIVSTDSFKDIEQAKQEQNQTTINNNIISNFNELDSTLQHGNTTSQSAENSNNQMNSNLNNTLNNFDNIENQYNQNISDNLNQIDLNFNSHNFGANFLSSAEWFTTQFNNIVLDTPFNGFIIFTCVVGLGLLLLGRFL